MTIPTYTYLNRNVQFSLLMEELLTRSITTNESAHEILVLNLLPHMLYLEHCIISINNSNFQIFSKNEFYISSVEYLMENGT